MRSKQSFLNRMVLVAMTLQAATGAEDPEPNEKEPDPRKLEAAIVAIVALLIGVTILFEEGKERIEELSSRSLRPVVEALFGEMTILGFLSACTFVVVKTPWPGQLSERWFGEEDLLVEVFEQVHFTVFFIMVSFVLQVIVLVYESKATEQEWKKVDMGHLSSDDAKLMQRLQKEFVLERSPLPPFLPSSNPVPSDFKFGHYLSLCLGHSIAHVVHVQVHSWAFFLVITFVFYRIMLALHNDFLVLAWVWAAMGWLAVGLSVWFQHYLHRVMQAFAAPERLASTESESHGLLADENLPKWCLCDFDSRAERPCLQRCMKHHTEENRQTSLFMGGSAGPKVHTFILQTTFVFLGIYTALLIMTFLPKVLEEYSDNSTGILVYALVAILPILIIQRRGRFVVADAAILNSIGFCRRPQVVAEVLREEKIASVIRAFIVLDKMHRLVEADSAVPADSIETGGLLNEDDVELRELGKTFDALDRNGNGYISKQELQTLLYRMGKVVDTEHIHRMFSLLDANSDGRISRLEFLGWYKANLLGHHNTVSIHEQAHALFRLFDRNGNGSITVAEFKSVLDSLNVGFTVDEVGLIVHELDEDGNVTVGLHEFTELLEKFHGQF